MTDERINQLIVTFGRYAEIAKESSHMCDEDSSAYIDAMERWQEADDVVDCLENLKVYKYKCDELSTAFNKVANTVFDAKMDAYSAKEMHLMARKEIEVYKKALKEASIGIQCEYGGDWSEYYDEYLKNAREEK